MRRETVAGGRGTLKVASGERTVEAGRDETRMEWLLARSEMELDEDAGEEVEWA